MKRHKKKKKLLKLKPKKPYEYVILTVSVFVICFLILWFFSFISICGDNRCDPKECSYCKKDCTPDSCINGICDLGIGENCKNSIDCTCQAGYVCELTRSNLDEKGCYKITCGDDLCDRPDETESNCCLDCGCLSGYRCERSTNKCILVGPVMSASGTQEYRPSVTIMFTNPDLYWGSSPAISHPLFTISVSNSGETVAKNVQVGAKISTYSDWVYKTVEDLGAHRSITVSFNIPVYSSILEIKQLTTLTVSVVIKYNDIEGDSYSKDYSFDISVYGREYIDWSHPEFVAGWITDKDLVIREFVGKAAKGLAPAVSTSDIYPAAKRIWNQLSAYGVRYISDPRGMEYASFPAETLKSKSGDCEDLAILFATLLKAIGIKTEIVLVPGHALMAFYAGSNRYCVETTLLGSEFSSAINSGYNTCIQPETSRVSTESYYISPPSSIDVGTVAIPDISYIGGNWILTSAECSEWFIVCLEYRCEGKCELTFQNTGGGIGRKCGTFYVMATSTTYFTKATDCVDVATTKDYELTAYWYDSSSSCTKYSPFCRFYEE